MRNIDRSQKRLEFLVKQAFNFDEWTSLRGIIANWKKDTLYIDFFFSEKIDDEIKENASVLASEILAQYVDGFLEENYFYLPLFEDLPISSFWVYKKSF